MKRYYYLPIGILFFLVTCQQKPHLPVREEKVDQVVLGEKKKFAHPLLEEYHRFLVNLDSAEVKNMSKAAEKYKTLFKGQPYALTDSGFVLFEKFYQKVNHTLNGTLPSNTLDLRPLIYGREEESIPQRVLDYEAELETHGFQVEADEDGEAYLKQNRDFIAKHFYDIISPTLKEYLIQANREHQEGFTGDAALAIAPTEFADRIIWWEKYVKKSPSYLSLEEKKKTLVGYMTTFLEGIDNTPVLEPDYEHDPDVYKLSPYYAEAYQYLHHKAPNSEANQLVQPYFKALQKADTAQANKLLKQYRKAGIIFDYDNPQN